MVVPEAALAIVERRLPASAGYFSIVGPVGGGRGSHGAYATTILVETNKTTSTTSPDRV